MLMAWRLMVRMLRLLQIDSNEKAGAAVRYVLSFLDTAKNLNNYICIMDASLNLEGGILFILIYTELCTVS